MYVFIHNCFVVSILLTLLYSCKDCLFLNHFAYRFFFFPQSINYFINFLRFCTLIPFPHNTPGSVQNSPFKVQAFPISGKIAPLIKHFQVLGNNLKQLSKQFAHLMSQDQSSLALYSLSALLVVALLAFITARLNHITGLHPTICAYCYQE